MNDRRLLVLDDDPTGSQCVAGVDIALTDDPDVPAHALHDPGSVCFVLTNSRALDESAAVGVNRRIVGGVLDRLPAGTPVHVVSRSDSTLRGHVIAEPNAIADELAAHGIEVDGFLLCPAMIEAGRSTADDVHRAVVDGEAVPVALTDFAADATFGYHNSNLREFIEERSSGAVRADDVLSISLTDIRDGGPDRVEKILRDAHDRRWVVVNATEYADMDVVAEALRRRESEGRVFVSRCAPSFVRSLAGQKDAALLDDDDLRTAPGRLRGGLVVVGSHVGLTTAQLAVVQERSGALEVALHVPTLLDPDPHVGQAHIAAAAQRIREHLADGDCVLYTSRDLVRTQDRDESLAIARRVSDAVVAVVQAVRDARPAWVIAKGGITSHEVAASGLGIRRAEVVGQFFPGQISMFRADVAPADVLGMPYVVFPGNVGGTTALADVIERMRAAANRHSTANSHSTEHGEQPCTAPNDGGQH